MIRKAEGIADVIGHLLDGLDLVVVSENDGVALSFKGEDFFLNRRQRGRRSAGLKDQRFVV